jgi:Sec7-like guanine-nucleotide exchange factor
LFLWFSQIGQFLGEEANEAVRVEYCKLFDFRDVPILACLRTFLQAFQLPKEAQQIDRVCVLWCRAPLV